MTISDLRKTILGIELAIGLEEDGDGDPSAEIKGAATEAMRDVWNAHWKMMTSIRKFGERADKEISEKAGYLFAKMDSLVHELEGFTGVEASTLGDGEPPEKRQADASAV